MSFLEKFIKYSFISIIKNEYGYFVLKEIYKNKKLIHSEKKDFHSEKDKLEYLKESQRKIPTTYISTISNSLNQGIINSCSKQIYHKFQINLDNIKILCINNSFSVYIGLFDINEIKNSFQNMIDFIFSPFLIINNLKKQTKNTIYVLKCDTSFALIIYNETIKYGNFFKIEEEIAQEEEIDIDDLDDIDLIDDTIEEIDDLSEDIDVMSENIDIDEDITNNNSQNLTDSFLKQDVDFINFIKDSLNDYYHNELYDSDFVENMVILNASNTEVHKDLLNFFENELLLNTTIQNIDILKEINSIAKKEINYV